MSAPITIIMSSLVLGPSPTEPAPADEHEDSTTWPSARGVDRARGEVRRAFDSSGGYREGGARTR